MTALTRLAEDVAVVVRGDDAVVLRNGTEVLRVPEAGPAAGWLAGPSGPVWDRRAVSTAPPAVRRLLAVLTEHRVVIADPVTEELRDLHARTVGGHLDLPPVPGTDTAFVAREAGTGPVLRLPPPDLGNASLGHVLRRRRSARTFGRGPIPLAALATILGVSAGPTSSAGPAGGADRIGSEERPDAADRIGPAGPARGYPSGGARYPVETHLVAVRVAGLPPAGYRYLSLGHALSRRAAAGPDDPVPLHWLPDLPPGDTAAVVLLTVDFGRRDLAHYGGRAYRLALLEAGHLAQNLLLVSTAVGVAGRPFCGYDDEGAAGAAGLAYPTEVVVYAVALGPAATPGVALPTGQPGAKPIGRS